jgi:homogentisate 1,2-dioxygenase
VIPDLGPIGANGLANERDFLAPKAAYIEDTNIVDPELIWRVIARFQGKTFIYKQDHCPFDVVAWHGNYYPYKYDLNNFNTMGSISFDHPDPSIFTVLTVQSDDPGQAILDFVIFPPRWLVAEHTFRPPYFHRNTMSEFMGNIAGTYDAKEKGFGPGASSLHSTMSGHGPETEVFGKASAAELKPAFVGADSLAFMFETCFLLKLTKYAVKGKKVDRDYRKCWADLPVQFKKPS